MNNVRLENIKNARFKIQSVEKFIGVSIYLARKGLSWCMHFTLNQNTLHGFFKHNAYMHN